MSRIVNVELPDGYEDAQHLVVVARTELGWNRSTMAATVLAVEDQSTTEVEEVGEGALTAILTDAARVIRTGTAARS